MRPLSLYYLDASADGVKERSLVPSSHLHARLRRNATMSHAFSCKLLIVGGGSGGCTMAAKFARRLPKDSVIVVEPSAEHFYQPLFTLVGAGVKKVSDCVKAERACLPDKAIWIKDYAKFIDPDKMSVTTAKDHVINYEYLIVAVGLKYDYDKVPGLKQALDDEKSRVSTIYSPDYCGKTWSDLQNFKGGDAFFTYPNTPIKCPGAPQKICYLAESYFTKTDVRSKSNVTYNTSLPVIFGVKKYADALMKVVEKKNINVNFKTVLKEIHPENNEAVFYQVDDPTKTQAVKYDLLHVTPPMSTPEVLSSNSKLVDKTGFLNVDKYTLQHCTYPNIYGLGDCTNTPNSKTAAAIAKQCLVLQKNLLKTMKGKTAKARYDGYGACPLLTGHNKCILAEFVYDGVPRETMPFNQANESILAYYMKKDLFPYIYWNLMLKGYYHGPEVIRKLINPLGK
ncbi:Sulfide:quinone oxidoreductase, mitochondrial [Eumeta japonica]|uniref:Sulfide:quinone oxidoreductase, mitochondrial n=1 Tax=Eumeta variegata TaxID=151549 RepID=A0A4C2A1M2_EUMVA|nr:Sulfide:quinone oxidoreductase, mitochondrial [Eumeta japonica]